MIDKADPGLQAVMIDTDITSGQGAAHTPGLKDPHPIQEDLGDHTQEMAITLQKERILISLHRQEVKIKVKIPGLEQIFSPFR